jgi:putative aldouronate transport system substrate-binding protein
MSIVRTDITPTNLPGSDTISSNGYLKLIKQSLNVDVTYSKLVGGGLDYDTQINLLIVSDSLPDVIYIDKDTQLNQLANAGSIADLTSVYNNLASPITKAFYSSYGNSKDSNGLAAETYNKKLMALPNTNLGLSYNLLWIRKDWMTKLNEPAPKTL